MQHGDGTAAMEMGGELYNDAAANPDMEIGSARRGEEILDARYLRQGESISQGDEVRFACHDVIVGERLDCDRGGALILLQGDRSSVSQI
jgi:hypothetical protein